MAENETFDVVVVGSGAAGAMAALRSADLGMKVLIVEKASKFGGTSAVSGGVMWLPNHGLDGDKGDNRDDALAYLDAIITKPVDRVRLEKFVDTASEMAHYLRGTGVELIVAAWPDYEPLKPGARTDRAVIAPIFDGRELGDDRYDLMREQFNRFKLFGRYSLDLSEMFPLMMQSKGWRQTAAKVIARYWLDRGTRALSRRDKRFVQGAALMGRVYQQVFKRGVELRLETQLENLVVDKGGRVTGIEVSRFGKHYRIDARHGVVLAAGGYEWNQELRDRFFPFPGSTRHATSPEDANRGEGLLAAEKIGAVTDHTEEAFYIPMMTLPSPGASNFHELHQAAFDVGRPWSVCVNRNGVRFVDEACGYDQFVQGMIRDHKATGANLPCWHVFDAKFRAKFSSGGFMPTAHTPERKIPKDWWDHYVFRANTLEELAKKIDIPVDALLETVRKNNEYAKTGIDPEFGKGMNIYDQFFGDPTVTPNPNIGPIDKAPFYAVPIQAGDLGTKGGLKCDELSRVLDGKDQPIAGLYAAGNQAATCFGNVYPGAGATIGPAMTFAYIAANDIAERSGNQRA